MTDFKPILLGACLAGTLLAAAAPARADWDDHHRGHWDHDRWHHEGWGWAPRWVPPPVYYASPPPAYYAPPPAYYPPPYYAAPSVTFGFSGG